MKMIVVTIEISTYSKEKYILSLFYLTLLILTTKIKDQKPFKEERNLVSIEINIKIILYVY